MTLPIDRTPLALAQANQVAGKVASAQNNIDTHTNAYNTIDELNLKVNNHTDAAVLPHPDGSVTEPKLANGSVGTTKIKNEAVDLSKVKKSSLDASVFVPGALTNDTQNALRITALQETVNVNLNDPKYGITGDGTDEITKIRQAFEDAMVKGKPIDLGVALTKYTISESIVIDRPLTIYANGENSIFEQLSWGVPCIEIRCPNVSIIGSFSIECNTARTQTNSSTLAASKNNAMVKAECVNDAPSAGAGIYLKGDYGDLYIDKLSVKGLICGVSLMGPINFSVLPKNLKINTLTVERVDFGLLGTGHKDFTINTIIGNNILRSQGVDEHVAYFTESTVRSEGLTIGSIIANGVTTPTAHVVSMKSVNDYYIGEIKGGGTVGALFTTRLANGYIGRISSKSSVGDWEGTGAIAIQDGAECEIDSVDIECEAHYTDASNRGWGIAITGDGLARIRKAIVRMKSSDNSYPVYISSTNVRTSIDNLDVIYNTTQIRQAIMMFGFGYATIKNPKIINGIKRLLYKSSQATCILYVNPNEIGEPDLNNITYEAGDFNTVFTAPNKLAFVSTQLDTQPSVRSFTTYRFARLAANTITTFRHGTNGQEFTCIAGDNLTTIQANANIVTKSGIDLTAGAWKLAKFIWQDGVAYEI